MTDAYEEAHQAQLMVISRSALQYGESAELLSSAGHPDAPFYERVAEAHRLMATDLAMLLGIVQ